MGKQYIFNSSMPRSGSELMQVLLHQNPDIYGSPTSPLLEYLFAARNNRQLAEVKAQPPELMDKAFNGLCRAAFDGYYDQITDRPIVCDKSRGWIFYYNWLQKILGEKPKVICVVRDLREILVSMEKVFRANRDMPIGPDMPAEMHNLTTDQRVGHWLGTQPVGLGLQRLYDAKKQGILGDIHVVTFEELTKHPQDTMDGVYEYLGLPAFKHSFDNVVKTVEEDHRHFGPYGSHSVRKKVGPVEKSYNEVLGKQLSSVIVENHKWYFDEFYGS